VPVVYISLVDDLAKSCSILALSQCSTAMAKACANVATVEEHTNLAQVMSKLAELEEKAQLIHEEQCDSDFFTLSELLKDYLSQISAVKVSKHKPSIYIDNSISYTTRTNFS